MKRSPIKRRTCLKVNPTKKRKPKVVLWSKRKKKLWDELSKLIRRLDGKCLMKGQSEWGKCGGNLQGSHILPKGTYRLLELHPHNIITLCYKHHIHGWHKNPWRASLWLDRTLSVDRLHTLDYLRVNSMEFKGFRETEWRELWNEYAVDSEDLN